MITTITPTPAVATNAGLARHLAQGIAIAKSACYENSVLALNDLGERPALYYVEGWLINIAGEYAIEHGWLELDRQVVDVTLSEESAEDYYAVNRYTPAEVFEAMAADSHWPLFDHNAEARAAMLSAYGTLPINYNVGRYWAMAGYERTGIKSIILE